AALPGGPGGARQPASASASSMRSGAASFGCGGGLVVSAVSTVLRSTAKPEAASSGWSPASPPVPSTPKATCPAPGNSWVNVLTQDETVPGAGGPPSSRKLPQ